MALSQSDSPETIRQHLWANGWKKPRPSPGQSAMWYLDFPGGMAGCLVDHWIDEPSHRAEILERIRVGDLIVKQQQS